AFDEALATTKEALIASRSEARSKSEVRTSRAPKTPKQPADIGGIFSEQPPSADSTPPPKST
ncbi:hypothetical protein GE061_005844, partial [Apolygus lucorum]